MSMNITEMTDQELDVLSVELTAARVAAHERADRGAVTEIRAQALLVQAELSRRAAQKPAAVRPQIVRLES